MARRFSAHAAFLALGWLTVAAVALEPGLERHWNGFIQVIPWLAIGVLAAGFALETSGRATATVVRLVAIAVVLAAIFGVIQHIASNYDAGYLDFRYAEKWPDMSVPSRIARAATKTVGPSPVLAPGVLAQAAGVLVLATFFRSRPKA